MTYGPIQMVVIGFDNADVAPEIAQELQAVRDEDIIRLIDLVFVSKDREGNIEGIEVTDFSWEEAVELGAIAGSLIGLGTGSSEAIEVGAEIGAQVADERYFGLTTEDVEEIAAQIPPGSSAAIALFEHAWAIGLKEAILDAGGFMIAHGMVTPALLESLGADLSASLAAPD